MKTSLHLLRALLSPVELGLKRAVPESFAVSLSQVLRAATTGNDPE